MTCQYILKSLPDKRKLIKLEVRNIDCAIKSIQNKMAAFSKSNKLKSNREVLKKSLTNEVEALNSYAVNYFDKIWLNEDIIFRAAKAIGSYLYPGRDSLPNNSYDKLIRALRT